MSDSTKAVTLAEMLEAMRRFSDNDTFRYFQTSYVNGDGVPCPGECLRLTFGELRGMIDPDSTVSP